MDASVRAALLKWPDVPDCYDWLALDQRGRWRLGQERQSIANPTMNAFISRNYAQDAKGRWLFQNGPQRVFVALDYTPWVWQIVPAGKQLALSNQVGTMVTAPEHVWLDEQGRFLVVAEGMPGVVHDHDSETLVDLLVNEAGQPIDADQLMKLVDRSLPPATASIYLNWNNQKRLALDFISSERVAAQFGFDPHPTQPPSPQTASS